MCGGAQERDLGKTAVYATEPEVPGELPKKGEIHTRFGQDLAVYLAPEVIGQINPSRTAVILQRWHSREVRK